MQSLIQKCHECHGQKIVKSLGNMTKECLSCKGKGYLEQPIQPQSKTKKIKSQLLVNPNNPKQNIKLDLTKR